MTGPGTQERLMSPQMQIVQPLNDQQLLILVAALSPGDTPQAKVQFAAELWGQALIAGLSQAEAYIREHSPEYIEKKREAVEAAQRGIMVPGPTAPAFLTQRNRKA